MTLNFREPKPGVLSRQRGVLSLVCGDITYHEGSLLIDTVDPNDPENKTRGVIKPFKTYPETSYPAQADSHEHFYTQDLTLVYIKFITEGRSMYFKLWLSYDANGREVQEQEYESEYGWSQLVLDFFPLGYLNRPGRPEGVDHTSREEFRTYVLLDKDGSRTFVDRRYFDLYFPNSSKISFRNHDRTKLWCSHEVACQLANYLSGSANYHFKNLGDLILVSEELDSPYLENWCVKNILYANWSDISLADAADLYEKLAPVKCAVMKSLRPLLFRLVQLKMMSLNEEKWNPRQMLDTKVDPSYNRKPY